MIAAIELRVVGTKHGTGIGSGSGTGKGVGALYIAIGAGTKIGTGTGRTVLDPPPVSTVSPSSSVQSEPNTFCSFTHGYFESVSHRNKMEKLLPLSV